MCVNEKIELFMAMRIRLPAAEAKRRDSITWQVPVAMELGLLPHSPPCTAASLPAPHPALIFTGVGWRISLSAGLAMMCSTPGVFIPALFLLLPQTCLEVTQISPHFRAGPPVQCGDRVMLVASSNLVYSTHWNCWEVLGCAAASHGWG